MERSDPGSERLGGAPAPTTCGACGAPTLEPLIELPGLPFTGLFLDPGEAPPPRLAEDQTLLLCAGCGHGQLARRFPGEELYGSRYHFRSGASRIAREALRFFLGFLRRAGGGRRFRCALEVGCNDLLLLRELGAACEIRIGVDLLWAGRKPPPEAGEICVIGAPVEALRPSDLPARPDLVLCRHTLEHLAEPREILASLFDLATPDALVLIEVPDFAALVRRRRFDQIFHQHAHYFGSSSLRAAAAAVGAAVVAEIRNPAAWGPLLVALARTGSKAAPPAAAPAPTPERIRAAYRAFRSHLAAVGEALADLEPVYGYGASQMLPTLAYHLGSDLGFLGGIFDDDPRLHGRRLAGLPPVIRKPPAPGELRDAALLLTAVDHANAILQRIHRLAPREIAIPLPIVTGA